MGNKVVSNTGPLLHLDEVGLSIALKIFRDIYIPPEVKKELKKHKVKIIKKVKVIALKSKFNDVAKILTDKYDLDLGEAQAIALALQERVDYFLTDDLDARTVSDVHNIEVHGTVGIILRAYREKIIKKEIAAKKIIELYSTSSLFITKALVEHILKSINDYKR
jgi:hypothetical protein